MEDFNKMWEKLGDIPINENEEIEEDFLHFKKGTDKFDIWHWVEEKYNVCLGDILNKKEKKNNE